MIVDENQAAVARIGSKVKHKRPEKFAPGAFMVIVFLAE